LRARGLEVRIDEKTGIVKAKGGFNLTQVVTEAAEKGINIARVSTHETDLETYFINLMGGHDNG
jgi:hypothetical protein